MHRERLPYILIPVAALIAILPLLANGCSCGHDFDFHLLNWMEAARQFAHGNLHPHWAYTAAWNAGEPRFVFYPPLSWTIGAILGLIFPWTWTPIAYTWLALTASGLSLYYLASEFTPPPAATVAAVLYTVNPYMLFTAYERTAYAELLAAAWIPLLLHAILRDKVTIPRIAIPIALLWLTNAPAAVMSCYALAILTLIRLATNPATEDRSPTNPGAPYIDSDVWASPEGATAPAHANPGNAPTQTRSELALNTLLGTTLGLTLAAFYIVPAAYERRFVQIAMAIIPFYRIQDNFLFHHTTDIPHDQVLHTASLIAITLIVLTAATLIAIRITQNSRTTSLLLPLTTITIAITLLLTPITQFIWTHAPELAFLQFPWRLLAILAAVPALAIALALKTTKLTALTTTTLAIATAAALTYPAYTLFHQTCDPEDTVQARLHLFHSNQGSDPTDEYTPTTADNDSLAQTNPPWWLSTDPDAKPPANSQPAAAPMHLDLDAPNAEDLILNLRDYPNWEITRTAPGSMHQEHPAHLKREDGLIAIPIRAGSSTIDITYIHTLDQTTGDIISTIALLALLLTLRQKTTAPS
ncbi:MAG: hypothetical protein ABSA39_15815 [Edaphobacter sp.]